MTAHLSCDEPATHQLRPTVQGPHVHANGHGIPTQATPDSYWVGGGVPQGEAWGHAWGNQQEQANNTRGAHEEERRTRVATIDNTFSSLLGRTAGNVKDCQGSTAVEIRTDSSP